MKLVETYVWNKYRPLKSGVTMDIQSAVTMNVYHPVSRSNINGIAWSTHNKFKSKREIY